MREVDIVNRLLALRKQGLIGPILAEFGRYWVCPVGLPFNLQAEKGNGMNLDQLEVFVHNLEKKPEKKPIQKEESCQNFQTLMQTTAYR